MYRTWNTQNPRANTTATRFARHRFRLQQIAWSTKKMVSWRQIKSLLWWRLASIWPGLADVDGCWVSDNWIFDKAPGVNIHIKARTWTQRRWCLKTASVGKCYKSKFHTLAREKVWILKRSLVELKRMIGWCWMMKIWFKLSEDHRSSWRGGMQSPVHSINRLTFTKLLYEVRSPGETNAVSQIHHTITQICSVCNNSNTITQITSMEAGVSSWWTLLSNNRYLAANNSWDKQTVLQLWLNNRFKDKIE